MVGINGVDVDGAMPGVYVQSRNRFIVGVSVDGYRAGHGPWSGGSRDCGEGV